MGRPLKIKQSTTIDVGFNPYNLLDQPTVVIPSGLSATQYTGVVGGGYNGGIATSAYPTVEIQANIAGSTANAYIITQKGSKKYLVATTDTVNAGSLVIGNSYVIKSLGNTNWTAAGAGVNPQVGDVFTAKTVGAGTGTASDVGQAILTPSASLSANQMSISFSSNGTNTLYATKLTNKYIWDNATPHNKYAVNFFTSNVTAAASGAQVSTWTNATGLYTLAQVEDYTS